MAALKKKNSEAMELVEQERHNYNAHSVKETETSLSSKILKDKLWMLQTHAKDTLKIMGYKMNMDPNYTVFQDHFPQRR